MLAGNSAPLHIATTSVCRAAVIDLSQTVDRSTGAGLAIHNEEPPYQSDMRLQRAAVKASDAPR